MVLGFIKNDALTEQLTDLKHPVKKQKQRQKERNGTSAETNNDDGEQLGDNASAETKNSWNIGTNTNIEPNSVKIILVTKKMNRSIMIFSLPKKAIEKDIRRDNTKMQSVHGNCT